MQFWVIIAAAGSGTRFGGQTPKQFEFFDNEHINERLFAFSVREFAKCAGLRGVTVVVPKGFEGVTEETLSALKTELRLDIPLLTVTGRETRQKSVYVGLKTLDFDGVVLIHDAARPFVKKEKIEETAQAACKYGAAVLASPVADTIKRRTDSGFAASFADRGSLVAAHTPQAFFAEQILKAHERAENDGFEATDDCAVAEKYGINAFIVNDFSDNIKITTKEDAKKLKSERN